MLDKDKDFQMEPHRIFGPIKKRIVWRNFVPKGKWKISSRIPTLNARAIIQNTAR
jgi:hypothetical protein